MNYRRVSPRYHKARAENELVTGLGVPWVLPTHIADNLQKDCRFCLLCPLLRFFRYICFIYISSYESNLGTKIWELSMRIVKNKKKVLVTQKITLPDSKLWPTMRINFALLKLLPNTCLWMYFSRSRHEEVA